ncbi:hypothetical protein niasHS_003722 [Heterodera schachtii]|uniref:Survival of motor neuron-related-splicing factor 30 n=1 Tax=Heterodera schachtii TaxID=97005 RepID=A0ABD2KHJ2_HETSC
MSSSLGELENYRLQLQQVEAALIAEPNNEELLKLKEDLNEIILLQQELIVGAGSGVKTAPGGATDGGDAQPNAVGSSSSLVKAERERIQWKVGDRCMAPMKSGQKHLAVIDGISQDKVAITFANTGKKDMVRLTDLSIAPVEEKKKYIFQMGKPNMPKKEWHLERERRKQRAQKKAERWKQLEERKEDEKNQWKTFTAKASAKNMKGLKGVSATGSYQDGPSMGIHRVPAAHDISSRRNTQAFGATMRGNMESLF